MHSGRFASASGALVSWFAHCSERSREGYKHIQRDNRLLSCGWARLVADAMQRCSPHAGTYMCVPVMCPTMCEGLKRGGMSLTASAQGVSFGVFGLGNKQYEHFCAVGKRVHKAMCALGASALVRRGDGDDDEDIETDFDSWRSELYDALDKADLLAKSTVGPAAWRRNPRSSKYT